MKSSRLTAGVLAVITALACATANAELLEDMGFASTQEGEVVHSRGGTTAMYEGLSSGTTRLHVTRGKTAYYVDLPIGCSNVKEQNAVSGLTFADDDRVWIHSWLYMNDREVVRFNTATRRIELWVEGRDIALSPDRMHVAYVIGWQRHHRQLVLVDDTVIYPQPPERLQLNLEKSILAPESTRIRELVPDNALICTPVNWRDNNTIEYVMVENIRSYNVSTEETAEFRYFSVSGFNKKRFPGELAVHSATIPKRGLSEIIAAQYDAASTEALHWARQHQAEVKSEIVELSRTNHTEGPAYEAHSVNVDGDVRADSVEVREASNEPPRTGDVQIVDFAGGEPLLELSGDGIGITAAGRRLTTWDTNSSPSRELGHVLLDSHVNSITQNGSVVAAWCGDCLLQLIDVSNPAAPRNAAYVFMPDDITNVTSATGRFVVGGKFGVSVVTEIESTKPVAWCAGKSMWSARQVLARDNMVYAFHPAYGIKVIEWSDDRNPRVLATQKIKYGDEIFARLEPYSIVLSEKGTDVLRLDISAPGKPRVSANAGSELVSKIQTEKQPGWCSALTTLSGPVDGLAATDLTTVVLAASRNDLHFLDITVPACPQVLSTLNIPAFGEMITTGTLAIAASWSQGIRLIDYANPVSPRLLNVYRDSDSNGRHHLELHGSTLFVRQASNRYNLIDISNSSSPTLCRRLPAGAGNGFIVFPDAGTPMIFGNDSISTVSLDGDEPTTRTVAKYNKYIWDVKCSGSICYVASGGLRVLDVRNQSNPREVATCSVDGHIGRIRMGDRLVLGVPDNGFGKFHVFDVSNPERVKVLHAMPDLQVQDAIVTGNYIYAALGENGLAVLRVDESALQPVVDLPPLTTDQKQDFSEGTAGLDSIDRIVSDLLAGKDEGINQLEELTARVQARYCRKNDDYSEMSRLRKAVVKLGQAAGTDDQRAYEMILRLKERDTIDWLAIDALGAAAAAGHAGAIEILTHPDDGGKLLVSSAVGALSAAGKKQIPEAVDFLASVAQDDSAKALWYMSSDALVPAAVEGSTTAVRALCHVLKNEKQEWLRDIARDALEKAATKGNAEASAALAGTKPK